MRAHVRRRGDDFACAGGEVIVCARVRCLAISSMHDGCCRLRAHEGKVVDGDGPLALPFAQTQRAAPLENPTENTVRGLQLCRGRCGAFPEHGWEDSVQPRAAASRKTNASQKGHEKPA
eukprot:1465613-Pleurochrysis_carterae.AAC.2